MNVLKLRIQTRAEHDAGDPLIPGNPPADDANDALFVIREKGTAGGQTVLDICLSNPLQPGHWVVTSLTANNVEGLMAGFRGAQQRFNTKSPES